MGNAAGASRATSTVSVASTAGRKPSTTGNTDHHKDSAKNSENNATNTKESQGPSPSEKKESQMTKEEESGTKETKSEKSREVKDSEPKSKKDEKEKKDAPRKESNAQQGLEDVQGRDVMISYSHADSEFMKKVKTGLEEAGITVWVDITGLKAGVDFLNKIGQAIIDATMFVQLLSESCIASKYCQDELALAYISNKPIFPVGMQPPSDLFPKMDTGVKLQLARFTWNLFTDPNEFDSDMELLVSKLNQFKSSGKVESTLERDKSRIMRNNSRHQVNKHLKHRTSFDKKLHNLSDALMQEDEQDFWTKNFKKDKTVPWQKFLDTFAKQYKNSLQVIFSKSDQEWLQRIIKRELGADEDDNNNAVTYDNYLDFCTVDEEELSFWQRVQDQAIESYTMKEVFDMNSSVRVEAIENLGKFRSKAVVEALIDLLKDKDNNIRAVAAISLARTGENSARVIKQLIRCLNDSDRLVREGACLALGHLKAEDAVTKILHLWRNDFISSVREAAQVALEQIGGNEANKAMYITKVLSEEIRTLTKD